MTDPNQNASTRREFLRTSAVAAAGTALSGIPALARPLAKPDTLKIGVIGCGGRGLDAVVNCFDADPGVKLTAMADVFQDKLQKGYDILKKDHAARMDVPPSRMFLGFDAYQKVLKTDVDMVILTTPPFFRPTHLQAALEAGKHTFCEKPVAVDTPGLLQVMKTAEAFKEKKLNLVSGLCWRYHNGVRATMERVLNGEIGDVLHVLCRQTMGEIWDRPVPPGASDVEQQIRNWVRWSWIGGDLYVENHVHSLDLAMWALRDITPETAFGEGGQEHHRPADWCNIFDHHAIVFHFPNGRTVQSYSRFQAGTAGIYETEIVGTKGVAKVPTTNGIRWYDGRKWKYEGDMTNMYVLEQKALLSAIREGRVLNNGAYMCNSTMVGLMGRAASYTGQIITWDQITNSKQVLGPAKVELTSYTPDPKPIPGKTILV